MKIETITHEYYHCGECSNSSRWFNPSKEGYKCCKANKIIPDLWGDIPDWCPLETKEVKNVKV